MELFFVDHPRDLMDEAKRKRVLLLAIIFLGIAYYLAMGNHWKFLTAVYFSMFIIGICCYFSKLQIVLKIYMIGLLVLIFVNSCIFLWAMWMIAQYFYTVYITDKKPEQMWRYPFHLVFTIGSIFVQFTYMLWNHYMELRGVRFV